MSSPETARIAVLLDFENVHRVGHGLYSPGLPRYQCVPEPSLIADMLANRRKVPTVTTSVQVFRGRPNPAFEPTPASAADKQRQLWERRDDRVRVRSHPLFYRNWPQGPPVEKGVDVALAIEAVRHTSPAVVSLPDREGLAVSHPRLDRAGLALAFGHTVSLGSPSS